MSKSSLEEYFIHLKGGSEKKKSDICLQSSRVNAGHRARLDIGEPVRRLLLEFRQETGVRSMMITIWLGGHAGRQEPLPNLL